MSSHLQTWQKDNYFIREEHRALVESVLERTRIEVPEALE